MTIKVLMVGHGAFAEKHMDGIKNIPGVEVVSICGRREDATRAAAEKRGIKHDKRKGKAELEKLLNA